MSFKTNIATNCNHNLTDQGYAWIVSISCCFINAILFGMFRSYGLLYSAILETYHVSRSDATWPFSLCMTVIHLSGPISGVLNSHLAVRTIVFIGCLLSAIGVGLCYFATSVADIVVFIGIIQGFGVGITYVQNPAIINEYFVRYRATANGIALCGGTIGAFVISPIIQSSLDSLGLQKTFLTLASLSLLTLPASLLLKPKKENEYDKMRDNLSKIFSISPVYLTKFKLNGNESFTSHHGSLKSDSSTNVSKSNQAVVEPVKSAFDEVSKKFVKIAQNMERKMSKQDANISNTIRKLSIAANKSKIRLSLEKIVFILQSPFFMIISMTHLAYFWGVLTFVMVGIDHAVDKGIVRNSAVYLITTFSAGDLVGRLGSGWFLDNRLIPSKYLAMSAIICTGIMLKCIPLYDDYYFLMTISCGLGLISGVIVIMLNTLFCKYLGTDNAAMAFALSSFFCGLLTLVRPMLVGYFRDSANGSYDGLFNLLSVFGFLAGALWLLEPFFRKRKKYNENLSNIKIVL